MFKKALIASAMLVSVIGANAADTGTVGVTGGATPGACNITLAGTGTADYGILTHAQVQALAVYNSNYNVGQKLIGITVACSGATKAEMSFTDNKAGKNFPVDVGDGVRFGVVDGSGTVAIGSYQMTFSGVTLDTVAAAGFLIAPNGTTTWDTTSTGANGVGADWVRPGYSNGFIKTAGNTVPDTFTNFAANLSVSLYLSKAYMDAATTAVTFNGTSVITMQYL